MSTTSRGYVPLSWPMSVGIVPPRRLWLSTSSTRSNSISKNMSTSPAKRVLVVVVIPGRGANSVGIGPVREFEERCNRVRPTSHIWAKFSGCFDTENLAKLSWYCSVQRILIKVKGCELYVIPTKKVTTWCDSQYLGKYWWDIPIQMVSFHSGISMGGSGPLQPL